MYRKISLEFDINVSCILLLHTWYLLFVQEVLNVNTSGGIPYPFNNTIDSAAYMGFEKLTDNGRIMADYIKVSNVKVSCLYLSYDACLEVRGEIIANRSCNTT